MAARRTSRARAYPPVQSYRMLRVSVACSLRDEYEAANPDWRGAYWPSLEAINERIRLIRRAKAQEAAH